MNYSLSEMELIIKDLEMDNFHRIKKDFNGEYHTQDFQNQLRVEIELLEKLKSAMEEVENERD